MEGRGPRILDVRDGTGAREAAGALGLGLVVAVPTDTVYGLAARIDRPEAVRRLFELKGRRQEVPIAVLVGNVQQAEALGLSSPRAKRLAAAFWPGPLTIVVARSPVLTADIGGDGATVGLRLPDHPALRLLLEATGPLATTSANRAGEATPTTAAAVADVFGPRVELYLDGGPSAGSSASTVVSDLGDSLTVLREGPIPAEALRAAAGDRSE